MPTNLGMGRASPRHRGHSHGTNQNGHTRLSAGQLGQKLGGRRGRCLFLGKGGMWNAARIIVEAFESDVSGGGEDEHECGWE